MKYPAQPRQERHPEFCRGKTIRDRMPPLSGLGILLGLVRSHGWLAMGYRTSPLRGLNVRPLEMNARTPGVQPKMWAKIP
jgi:hypothetical protein